MWSTIAAVVSGLGIFASLLLIRLRAASAYHRGEVLWLAEAEGEPPAGGWPTLAVIFPARDEEENVEQATRSKLMQDYPCFELIAVDDRSTDRTGAILHQIATEDARLQVVEVGDLPPGWLGKNHALQRASERVNTTWILFTDADVILEPSSLRRALALATREGLDHLAVTPDTITETEGERAFMAMFHLLFAFHAPHWKIRDRRSKASLGIGSFNLVKTEAFRAIGGLQRLTLSIDEDLRLGEALKFAGYRQAMALGRGAVSVRWQSGGIGGMIRGTEKNFFAALKFRLPVVVLGGCAVLVLGVGPYAGLFVGAWWSKAVCAVGIACVASVLADGRKLGGVAWYHALVLPIGAVACVVALFRSAWLTLWRQGVIWRDRFYPLAELRQHVRRREAWLREVWKSTR